MVSEIPLAVISAALRVAPTGRRTFVRVNFKADLAGERQYQNLAGMVPLGMSDELKFASRGRCAPEHNVANAVKIRPLVRALACGHIG